MAFSVESGDTATTRGTQETSNCRLISGPHQRESLPRDLTTQAAHKFLLLSPDHYIEAHPHCIPTTHPTFPHLLDFVNHPVLPQSPVELVFATKGEDLLHSYLPRCRSSTYLPFTPVVSVLGWACFPLVVSYISHCEKEANFFCICEKLSPENSKYDHCNYCSIFRFSCIFYLSLSITSQHESSQTLQMPSSS